MAVWSPVYEQQRTDPYPILTGLKANEFEMLRLVGSGNFSKVFAVQRLSSNAGSSISGTHPKHLPKTLAMKVVSKARLRQLKKELEVLMEKHCLQKLSQPSHHATEGCDASILPGYRNIVTLFGTGQDAADLYIFTEFCSGGELWDFVSRVGVLDETLGRFFVAQIVNAVEFIHSRHIVHRDLKAENIMLTHDGTLKVIDFGSAIDIERPDLPTAGTRCAGPSGRVFSNFVGTPEFMPPEAPRNCSSGFGADLWSLGCTIFQILAGSPPFAAPSTFLTHLLSRDVELDFPPFFPEAAKDLVLQLLQIDPTQRLGINQVKKHPYFCGVDFENPNCILKGKKPLLSLHEHCLAHMSKHWNRFRGHCIAAGWPIEAVEAEVKRTMCKVVTPSAVVSKMSKESKCSNSCSDSSSTMDPSPSNQVTFNGDARRAGREDSVSGPTGPTDGPVEAAPSCEPSCMGGAVTAVTDLLLPTAAPRKAKYSVYPPEISPMTPVPDEYQRQEPESSISEMANLHTSAPLEANFFLKADCTLDTPSGFWSAPSPPIALEERSRELIRWSGASTDIGVRRALRRVIHNLYMLDFSNGARPAAYWDLRVKEFLKTPKPDQEESSGGS